MRKIVLLLILFLPLSASAQKQTYASIQDALNSSGSLSGKRGPSNVVWINNGDQYSYTTYNPETKRSEIRIFDVKTQTSELIFDGDGINFPESETAFSYRSFQWAADSRHLVFQTNFRPVYRNSGYSDYYLFDTQTKTLQTLALDAYTAELAPDGSKVAYEKGGNLFVFNLNDKQEKQLTFDGEDQKYNGRFGWVYEEEFGLVQGWQWSHDSEYIAFWQQDEREVNELQITDYSGTHNQWVTIPYPKVGDANPITRIGVVNVTDGALKWMETGEDQDSYIPRIYWTSKDHTLAVVHLNRAQTHLKLFMFDVREGEKQLVMEEISDAWIDVFDFFAGIMDLMFFPKDLDEFFWVSDREGYAHIYRYDYSGKLLNKVTDGAWEVTYVNAIDTKSKTLYYTSTEVHPTERHLYSIRFNGKRKRQLTKETGTHSIDMSPNTAFFIDSYSNVATPQQVLLKDRKGKTLLTLEDNAGVKAYLQDVAYSPKELFSFTTSDGQELDAYMIKPLNFDSAMSYPVVLDIYGGPGAQSVYNSFDASGWHQYLAQTGYVVVSVNNRGSGGYGRDFEKVVYKQLGKYESQDFVETAKFLSSKSWIDADNMAIRGHSYGGYMSSMTMTRHPGVFKLGIVGAPLTDWRLYDSIYAERYMGLIGDNAAGYDSSAVMSYAKNLSGDLLIAHSAMDENVHMKNTMQLVKALTDEGKDADLRIYPPGAHGVAYNRASYYLLYQTYIDYLEERLKPLRRIAD